MLSTANNYVKPDKTVQEKCDSNCLSKDQTALLMTFSTMNNKRSKKEIWKVWQSYEIEKSFDNFIGYQKAEAKYCNNYFDEVADNECC